MSISSTAVAAHKYVISFCVGLELYNANIPKKLYAIYTLTLAITSVIGIGIGTVIISGFEGNQENYMSIWVGIFQVIYDKFCFRNRVLIFIEVRRNRVNFS